MARPDTRPHVVIVGGGFGGLYAARALADRPVRVTLLDRRNHHLFQPLLYQVATAALNPSDIAMPVRAILRRQRNARVLLGDVESIDPAARQPWMTFVIVGAGPTGVELAGAIAEIARHTLEHDFRAIDPRASRIV